MATFFVPCRDLVTPRLELFGLDKLCIVAVRSDLHAGLLAREGGDLWSLLDSLRFELAADPNYLDGAYTRSGVLQNYEASVTFLRKLSQTVAASRHNVFSRLPTVGHEALTKIFGAA